MITITFKCRIVVYGDDMFEAVVPGSAKPFNFQKAYKLTVENVNTRIIFFITETSCLINVTMNINLQMIYSIVFIGV